MMKVVISVVLASLALIPGRAYEPLPHDLGAAGTYQKLLKLRTIASVMHTTAHPDDEHGGLLAWLSRGTGARVSMTTLTRGEGGDNAIGPQLFDALGLIRTEELLVANRYYGVDAQYFTDVIDYGFSKRVDEAIEKLVPNQFAPKPGELTARAEEVSEEDSPVELLAPDTQSLTWPNRITAADFSGWIEQRGSKFWSAWDPSYRPIIAAWDRGQAPQRGGWLWTRHGKGHYTYFAYALHRQLPHGVPGAFRLLANVLALGKNRN